MAENELIKDVASNTEKSDTYKKILSNYYKSRRQGFYFEGLLLIYALLEDRTSSILYYCGFTKKKNRRSATGREKIKQDIKIILGGELKGFNTFSKKLNTIDKIVKWAKSDAKPQTDFQRDLKRSINRSKSLEKILKTVESLNGDWRENRNKIIHGLANKDYFDAQNAAKEICKQGKDAFDVLDRFSKLMKNKEIREKFKIQ